MSFPAVSIVPSVDHISNIYYVFLIFNTKEVWLSSTLLKREGFVVDFQEFLASIFVSLCFLFHTMLIVSGQMYLWYFSWLYWNINIFKFNVSTVIWWRCVLLNDYHSKVSWHLLHLINYHCMYMCEIRTFKIYSLSNFHVSNTVLLIIITMLYAESPELTNVITGSLYPLTKHLPICLTPQLLRTTILLSVSMSL